MHQPPDGYYILPAGKKCRCLYLWRDVKGGNWCCNRPEGPTTRSDDGSMFFDSDAFTVGTARPAPPSLTMEALNRAIDQLKHLPPPPLMVSSSLFPPGQCITFQYKGRTFIGGAPDFWAAAPFSLTEANAQLPSYLSLKIYDIDASVDGCHLFPRERAVFFEALRLVMVTGCGPIEDAICTAIERGALQKAAPNQAQNEAAGAASATAHPAARGQRYGYQPTENLSQSNPPAGGTAVSKNNS